MRNRPPRPRRRLFDATPAGFSVQALAVAALVILPAAILAALPSPAPAPPPPIAAERMFATTCARSSDLESCRCVAVGLRAVLSRDDFRDAVLRTKGDVFSDRSHGTAARYMLDACLADAAAAPLTN